MRLASAMLVMLLSGGNSGDHHPTMGLWEATESYRDTVPPNVAEAIKAKGRQLPQPGIPVTIHTCMELERWKQRLIETKHPTGSCVLTRDVSSTDGQSVSILCQNPGAKDTIDMEMSWRGGRQIHQVTKITVFDRQGAVDHVTYREINSHFLSPDCGSIVPGAPVVIR